MDHITMYLAYVYVWIYVSVVEICQGNMQMRSTQVNTICNADHKIKEAFLRRINDQKIVGSRD